MLPKHRHEHDIKWLNETIARLPVALQIAACDNYDKVYQAAMDAEPISYKKSNAARFAANCRLRLYVEAVVKKMSYY